METRYYAGTRREQQNTRKTTVISADDYLSITQSLEAKKKPDSVLDSQRLHELSQKRVSNWRNTAKNQRNARLHAREERLNAEKEAREQQDIVWAQEAQARNNAIVDRARNMQLHQTEAVRLVNSKLLLEAQLRERELQIEHKKKLSEARKKVDSEFLTQSEIIQKREDALRMEKEIKVSQAAKEIATSQKEQANKAKANRIRHRQAALAETPMIRALDVSYAEQMRAKLAENHRHQKELQAELIAAKEDAIKSRDQMKLLSEDSDMQARKWRDRKNAQDQALAEASKKKWVIASSLAENLDRQRKEKAESEKIREETSRANAQAEQESKFVATQKQKNNKNLEFNAEQHTSFKERQIEKAERTVLENQEKQAKMLEMIQKKADYELELQDKKAKSETAMRNVHIYRQGQIARKRGEEAYQENSSVQDYKHNIASQLHETEVLEQYIQNLHLDPVVKQQVGVGVENVQLFGSRLVEAERKRLTR